MKNYEVKVLKPGYAIWLGPTQQRADGTITLIKGPKNVIVDTGSPWDREFILKALKKERVRPDGISFVVCTHGHSDHIGNNNLFPNAIFIVSYDVCKGDLYTFHDFASGQPYKIDDQVEVIPTPGHTKQDISVIVRTPQGVVAIVGDLFENENDIENENLWRSFSEFPEQQEINRKKVLEIADFIVPGHGNIFRVEKGRSIKALSNLELPMRKENRLISKVFWYLFIPLVITIAGGLIIWVIVRWLTKGNYP
jgi:glyoxylase-like metal-dependent hydrolase (beta-lactamase superfamily II)